MRRLFGKQKSKVAGDIACLGLTDWWNQTLDEQERSLIRRSFVPRTGYAIDAGPLACEGQRASKLLGAAAGWIKNPSVQLLVLNEAERRASYVMDQHFAYSHLIEYWYRLRDELPEARGKAIQYCQMQIGVSKSAAKEFRDGDRDMNAMLKKHDVKPPKFDGRMPFHVGFTQLAVIREKEGEFADAIRLCKQAKKDGWSGDWDKRIARLKGKLARSG